MAAQVATRVLSAHDVFKLQHGRRLRRALLMALAALAVLVVVLPEYQPSPYVLRQEATRLLEIEVEAVEVPPEPERRIPPVLREIEAAPADDPGVLTTIPDIDEILQPIPTTPAWTPGETAPFVASSTRPRLVRGAQADYPEIARLAGVQGLVMVKVLVGVDGRVERVALLKGVHALIDRPALEAATRLVFEPGRQRDMPVACWVAVPFRFSLE